MTDVGSIQTICSFWFVQHTGYCWKNTIVTITAFDIFSTQIHTDYGWLHKVTHPENSYKCNFEKYPCRKPQISELPLPNLFKVYSYGQKGPALECHKFTLKISLVNYRKNLPNTSSPKLLGPNLQSYTEMILGWFSSKIIVKMVPACCRSRSNVQENHVLTVILSESKTASVFKFAF